MFGELSGFRRDFPTEHVHRGCTWAIRPREALDPPEALVHRPCPTEKRSSCSSARRPTGPWSTLRDGSSTWNLAAGSPSPRPRNCSRASWSCSATWTLRRPRSRRLTRSWLPHRTSSRRPPGSCCRCSRRPCPRRAQPTCRAPHSRRSRRSPGLPRCPPSHPSSWSAGSPCSRPERERFPRSRPPSSSVLAWPGLREIPELSFDGRLVHVLRMRPDPGNEPADDGIARGRRVGRTDEGLGVRAREGRQIVVVGAHEVAVTEVERLLVARIFGRDRAQAEKISGRLDLEVAVGHCGGDGGPSGDRREEQPDRDRRHATRPAPPHASSSLDREARVIQATASSRLCTPSFSRMFCTWLRTVAGLKRNRVARTFVLAPVVISRRTSISRFVRLDRGPAALAGARSDWMASRSALVVLPSRNT